MAHGASMQFAAARASFPRVSSPLDKPAIDPRFPGWGSYLRRPRRAILATTASRRPTTRSEGISTVARRPQPQSKRQQRHAKSSDASWDVSVLSHIRYVGEPAVRFKMVRAVAHKAGLGDL